MLILGLIIQSMCSLDIIATTLVHVTLTYIWHVVGSDNICEVSLSAARFGVGIACVSCCILILRFNLHTIAGSVIILCAFVKCHTQMLNAWHWSEEFSARVVLASSWSHTITRGYQSYWGPDAAWVSLSESLVCKTVSGTSLVRGTKGTLLYMEIPTPRMVLRLAVLWLRYCCPWVTLLRSWLGCLFQRWLKTFPQLLTISERCRTYYLHNLYYYNSLSLENTRLILCAFHFPAQSWSSR